MHLLWLKYSDVSQTNYNMTKSKLQGKNKLYNRGMSLKVFYFNASPLEAYTELNSTSYPHNKRRLANLSKLFPEINIFLLHLFPFYGNILNEIYFTGGKKYEKQD